MGGVAPSPVVNVPGFVLASDQSAIPSVYLLYTTDPNVPERVDSVYMSIDFGTLTDPLNDQFAVVLVAQNGRVIDQSTTPLITLASGSLILTLNWARGAADPTQAPVTPYLNSGNNTHYGFVNMTLPDIVLPTASTVQLWAYLDDGFEGPDVQVTDGTITTTRNAGAVSGTSLIDLTPFLLPASTG